MIPLKLTFEGLYSYQEKQTIDFEQLTAAGIFGIFGETGSGKSAILEAISFALFGHTERLNQRDERLYNMLNLKSDRCELDFEFLNFKNEKFRVVRSFRRNSRNYADVKPHTNVLYKYVDGEWNPTEVPVDEILNITYTNFKRTIIIPQGQFKEFLELGPTDRTNMLEEIFQLERFDLAGKAISLQSRTKAELDKIEGELKAYEEISKEIITQQKEEFKKEELVFKTEKKALEEVKVKYQELKKVKDSFETLQKDKVRFEKMNSEKKAIEEQKKRVEEYEKVSRSFAPLLKEKTELKSDIQKREKELASENKILEELKKERIKQQILLEQIEPYYKNINERRKEEGEYSFVINAREAMLKLAKSEKDIATKTAEFDNLLKQIETVENSIKANEADVAKKKKEIIEPAVLLGVSQWFINKKQIDENIEKYLAKIESDGKNIETLTTNLKELGVTLENYEKYFSESFNQVKTKLQKLEKSEQELLIQQKLSEYSDALHNGEPCPLCGSEDHPNVVQIDSVSEHLKAVEVDVKLLKNEELKLQKAQNSVVQIVANINSVRKQQEADNKSLVELKAKQKSLDESFVWSDYDKNDFFQFETKRKESEKISKEVAVIEKQIGESRKNSENLHKVRDENNKTLESLRLTKNEATTAIALNKQNLTILNFDDFAELDLEQIKAKEQKLKNENDKIECKHKEVNDEISKLQSQIAEKEGSITAITNQLKEFVSKLKVTEDKIVSECEKFTISEEKVVEILKQSIDIDAERKKINEFQIEFETLKNKINELEKELAKVEFSTEKYALVEKEYLEKEEALSKLNEKIIGLKNEIERLEKAFLKKEELLKNQSELSNRYENLRTISGLFKAKGFVNYISGIYLRQLCEQANVRFQRITRNRLSLQVNEKNDFEVIDYLNGGKTRSVKTLSGGQSFQASLSLALALAESVQAKSKTENNFFFIDEGFGTQDINSVNLIFETLRNLNQENKIVGVISHVDELKERIPSSLVVTKDDENGSTVKQTFA